MRILLSLFFAFFLLFPLAPAEASLVPCGQNNDDPTTTTVETDRCKLCHIVSGIAGLINYARDIMTFIALVVLVGMGVLYIVSAGNESMMGTAKGGIKAALVGFTIILTAWIIVNTIIFTIFQSKPDLGVRASFSLSNGFSFNCGANLNDAAVNAIVTGGTIPTTAIAGLPAGAVVSPLSCTGSTCTATVTSGGVVIGTVTGTQTGSNFTGTYTASVPGTAPSGCSVKKVPEFPITGASIVLEADCTVGTEPFTYAWSSATACENGSDKKTCVKNSLTSGSHSYSVTVSNGTAPNATVSGSFNAGTSYVLTVTNASSGGGSGLVTSTNVSGISCGDDCSENFMPNNSVMLKAEPSADSSFSGWSGGCSGTNQTCALVMTSAKTVTATFSKVQSVGNHTVTVVKAGSGTGVVTGGLNPDLINCGNDCSASYPSSYKDYWVPLNAVPSESSSFVNWTGCSSVNGTVCWITLNESKTVTVSFADNGSQSGKFWVSPDAIKHKPGVRDSTTMFSYNVSGGPPNGVLRWGSSSGMIIGTLDANGNLTSTGWWYPSGCAGSGTPGFTITSNAYIDGVYFGSDTLRCEAP